MILTIKALVFCPFLSPDSISCTRISICNAMPFQKRNSWMNWNAGITPGNPPSPHHSKSIWTKNVQKNPFQMLQFWYFNQFWGCFKPQHQFETFSLVKNIKSLAQKSLKFPIFLQILGSKCPSLHTKREATNKEVLEVLKMCTVC